MICSLAHISVPFIYITGYYVGYLKNTYVNLLCTNIVAMYCVKCSFYTCFQDVRGVNTPENQAGESGEKEGEGPDIVNDNVLSASSKGGQESNASDLDLSLYQIINIDQNTVSLAESSGVGFDKEIDVGYLNVGGKK